MNCRKMTQIHTLSRKKVQNLLSASNITKNGVVRVTVTFREMEIWKCSRFLATLVTTNLPLALERCREWIDGIFHPVVPIEVLPVNIYIALLGDWDAFLVF